MRLRATEVLFVLGCSVTGAAQDAPASWSSTAMVDSIPQARLRFERLLNTFTWNADAHMAADAGPWSVEARQHLRSRLIRSQLSVQTDEYQGGFDLQRSLTPLWAMLVRERSSVVAGPASIDLGELAQHRVLGGLRAGEQGSAMVSGLGGWEWNRQQGRRDAGPSLWFLADVPSATWEEITWNGHGSWRSSDLGERKPSDGEVEMVVRRQFGASSEFALSAAYRTQRRDLPTISTGTVIGGPPGPPGLFRRDENAVVVRNSVWIALAPSLRGSLDAGWNSRTVDRSFSSAMATSIPLPTEIRQLQFDAAARLAWEPSRGWLQEASMGLIRGEEAHDVREREGEDALSVDEQRRQARRRSNQSQRVYVSLRSGNPIDDDTDLSASVSSNLLRYDTPDTLNTDDRDELLLTGGLELARRWNRWFSTHLFVDGALDHLVYLSRYQSANNVTIRTLRLSPAAVWKTSEGFRNAMRAEVAASYTVFDFEDQVGGVQSYSYRQALWADSLVVPFGKSVLLEFSGSLRLFERGLLRWSEFRERPERSFKELAWWPRLRVRRWSGVSVAVGFRSFRQERTVIRDGVRRYDGAIGSSGPTVDLEILWRSGGRLLLSGWRETQRSESRILDAISNLMIEVTAPL